MSGSDNVVPCGSSGEELVEDKTSKEMKSEEYPWMMLEQLNKQRMDNLYCDFTICIEDEEYPVHQGILAARSEYFNAMFTSKLKEGFEKRVEIKESSKQCIERILGFLYSGKIELSVENIEETIRCAALMQIPDLLQVASEYVDSIFNAENCIHFRGLAKLLYMDDLVKKADKYLLVHFRDVCRDKSWNELSAEDVEMFISSEDVVVESEEVVYECMVGWVKHHLQSRKQYFPTLFKHLRLTSLRINYIEQVVRKEDLLYEFRESIEMVWKHYFDTIGSTTTSNPRHGDFPYVNINFVSDVRCGKFNLHENKVEVKQHEEHYKTTITASTVYGNKVYVCSNNQVKSYDGKIWENVTTLQGDMQCQHMVVCGAENYYSGMHRNVPQKGTPHLFVLKSSKTYANEKQVTTNQIALFDFQSKQCFSQWEVRHNSVDCFREGAVVFSDGRRIFILGGKQYGCAAPQVQTLSTFGRRSQPKSRSLAGVACSLVDIYEEDKQSWTRGKDMKVARRNFAAVKLHSRIYCFGGIGLNDTRLSSGEFMNIVDGVWTMLTNNIPLQLGVASACCVGDHIVMYGSGKISSMNSYTEEWKIWSEDEENKLLQGKGILFTSCS
uniref:kelch-like protein 3 isoform X3 n=1 Tax=Ciona intestinalis TaxID=7719 RepID=UPI000EF4D90E|nr:kelch-like protein 3 isoform X3 [Ciona intestinalis]|eukprot:XP_026693878.1 kelch-like protein 3 isoform X3 [Ciona intestinalis]